MYENSAVCIQKVMSEGIYDFKVKPTEVDVGLSTLILDVLSKSNGGFFLTIGLYGSSKGNYILMRKSPSDPRTYLYSPWNLGSSGINKYYPKGKQIFIDVMNTCQYKTKLKELFGREAELYRNDFVNLLRYGCSLEEYINGISRSGTEYSTLIDVFIRSYNCYLYDFDTRKKSDSANYLWSQNFMIGFYIKGNRVVVVCEKSVYADEREKGFLDNENKEENAKKDYLDSLSLNTLLNGINSTNLYGDRLFYDDVCISLSVSDFYSNGRKKILCDYLAMGNYIVVANSTICFTKKPWTAVRELSPADFKKLFSGSKKDTSTLIHLITEGGETPELVSMLSRGRVKFSSTNMVDILGICQDIEIHESFTVVLRVVDGHYSIMSKGI